jgi:hypothetical protein
MVCEDAHLLAGVRRLARGAALTGLFGGALAGSSDCSGPGLAGCASDVCSMRTDVKLREQQCRALPTSCWWPGGMPPAGKIMPTRQAPHVVSQKCLPGPLRSPPSHRSFQSRLCCVGIGTGPPPHQPPAAQRGWAPLYGFVQMSEHLRSTGNAAQSIGSVLGSAMQDRWCNAAHGTF